MTLHWWQQACESVGKGGRLHADGGWGKEEVTDNPPPIVNVAGGQGWLANWGEM